MSLDQVATEYAARVAAVETAVVDEKNERIAELESHVNALYLKLEETRAAISAKYKEVNGLRETLRQRTGDRDRTANALARFTAQLETRDAELAEARVEIERLRASVQIHAAAYGRERREAQTLVTAETVRLRDEVQQLTIQRNALLGDKTILQRRLAEVRSAVEAFVAANSNMLDFAPEHIGSTAFEGAARVLADATARLTKAVQS